MTEEFLKPTVSVRGVITGPNDNILVLQRATDAEWELPGGRLGPYESVCDGLHREVYEETTLVIEIEDILLANSWLNEQNNDRFAVYYACETAQTAVSLSKEHTDFQWAPLVEATSLLSKPQATAAHRSCERSGEYPTIKR